MLDGQGVPGLLVPAVPQVGRLADQGDGEVGDLLVAQADQVGRIVAVIVAHNHLFDLRPDLVGDAVEHLGQCGGRVVRHHEHADPLLLDGPHGPPPDAVPSDPQYGTCRDPKAKVAVRRAPGHRGPDQRRSGLDRALTCRTGARRDRLQAWTPLPHSGPSTTPSGPCAASSCSPRPDWPRGSCRTTRVRPCTWRPSGPVRPSTGPPWWRSVRGAGSRRSIWERRPRRPGAWSSASTTTTGPRRTRPDGSTTTTPWWIRSPAASTRFPAGDGR